MGSVTEPKQNGVGSAPQELDALVVGAGFGGVYQLKIIRDAGYSVKLLEHGQDYGGVCPSPYYQFSDPALWEDWTFKHRFPGSAELLAYFAHVANKWDLRANTQFNTFVTSADWNDAEARWLVNTKGEETYKVRFLLLNTGFAAKRYIPDWKGIDTFKGTILHPSYWPHEGLDLHGKRIAVVGTGATGVQLAQELSKVAGHLTVFQRTPNMALPMGQVDYQKESCHISKSDYTKEMTGRTDSFGGFFYNFLPKSTFSDTPEQRQKVYEDLWSKGDFQFWLAGYHDMLFDPAANKDAYNFWRDKTRQRINDPKVADILAPMVQPHAFGCKRISLELGYFDIFNQSNVSLVDISNAGTPIEEITKTGIKTTDKERDFDIIISATGYDALTGGLRQINITGSSGQTLHEYWQDGAKTYLGLAVSGFPNMFFTYGPQAPTAFCNGPTCAELQGNWILGAMNYMRENSLRKMDAHSESEQEWKRQVLDLANASLLPTVPVSSWYMGTNIPGKAREPYVYLGGVPAYYKTINEVADNGYEGFEMSRAVQCNN
ncbi:cyclopentanone 1,2-monooxygenase [Phaeosphaeria sp. MPI-PUGE-AT-0046c]|nr:cyclopentanone 1,2-monooxygenase [Phaeosphaeria sp. MPI-PUGE-AT-0046c]